MRRGFALVTLLFLLPLASASDLWCVQDVEGEIAIPTTTTTLYLYNDPCQLDGCAFSIWIYEETNGIDGMQVDWFGTLPGPCHPEGTLSDTIIF